MSEDHMEHRVGIVDKAEALYLRLLRWIAIIIATLLLAFAAWNGLSSAFNYLQTLDVFQSRPADVTAADMVAAASPAKADAAPARASVEVQKGKLPPSIYDAHAKKMFQIWKDNFEPYRPKSDPALTFADFSDWYQTEYINGTLRKHDVLDWLLDGDRAEADLDMSVEVLAEAAKDPAITARMKAFQSGKSKDQFWDRYDQTFMRLIDGYWLAIKAKREEEAAQAVGEKAIIAEKRGAASASLFQGGIALAGFLGLMFVFLVVAMERHQRRIAAEIATLRTDKEEE